MKLHIDESIKPTAQPHRRIPFHMRKKVEKELQRLEDCDVIEKVTNKPTPWVSPIVVGPKPKSPEEIRSDDILVKGNTVAEQGENLLAVILKLNNSGYTINYPKCVIRKQQLDFHGHVISHNGISADPGSSMLYEKRHHLRILRKYEYY